MDMAQRNIEAYGLVPIIVSDQERARRVQVVLLEIWQLASRFNSARNAEMLELAQSSRREVIGPAEPMRRVNQHSKILWQEYRALMLQLRELLSCAEYIELMNIHQLGAREEESCFGPL